VGLLFNVLAKKPYLDSLFLSPLTLFFCMFFHILGKFRHLPVVENGEVMAMLDIAKCLYDAIARLEKAAEQGSAIAAAVEGVERQLGGNFTGLAIYIFIFNFNFCDPGSSTLMHKMIGLFCQ
jgi:hypothetical protein